MFIRKLEEVLDLAMSENIQDLQTIAKQQLEYYLYNESLDENLDSVDMETIEQQLADELNYKVYGSSSSTNALTIDVKNRPRIDENKIGIDTSTREFNELLEHKLQLFAEQLQTQHPEFVVLGRMGGYWGLDNLDQNIKISEQGIEAMVQKLVQIAKDNKEEDAEGTLEQAQQEENEADFLYEVLTNNAQQLFELLLDKQEYTEIDSDYLAELQEIEQAIDSLEEEMNTKEYWNN